MVFLSSRQCVWGLNKEDGTKARQCQAPAAWGDGQPPAGAVAAAKAAAAAAAAAVGRG